MNCSQCGLHIPEGAQTCPNCRAPVRQPGFLERLFGWLAPARQPTIHRQVIRKTEIKEQPFQIVEATGQQQVYRSLEEVPPELRSTVEEALRAAASGAAAGGKVRVTVKIEESRRTVSPAATQDAKVRITVKDASGQERTYHSVEEMPPEIRALYERARQNRPS